MGAGTEPVKDEESVKQPEVWINVRRSGSDGGPGGQHDDLGLDWPDLPPGSPMDDLVALTRWADGQCAKAASEGEGWPAGRYWFEVFEGRERSGEPLSLVTRFDWPGRLVPDAPYAPSDPRSDVGGPALRWTPRGYQR